MYNRISDSETIFMYKQLKFYCLEFVAQLICREVNATAGDHDFDFVL